METVEDLDNAPHPRRRETNIRRFETKTSSVSETVGCSKGPWKKKDGRKGKGTLTSATVRAVETTIRGGGQTRKGWGGELGGLEHYHDFQEDGE